MEDIDSVASPKEGDVAPDIGFEDKDGKSVKLSDYRGKKNVILLFLSQGFHSRVFN